MTFYKFKTTKHNLINNIIRLNKIAIMTFDIKLLKKEELYSMKICDLKNIEAELRVQTGSKRHMNYTRGI